MKEDTGSGSFTRASLDFFGGFLRDPRSVGSVIPSSGRLERRVVAAADLASARAVVEFGPGTGGTTRALLRVMPAEGRLLALDVDPRFVAQVGAIGDERLESVQGSAADLDDILRERGWPAPDRVVTGIPFSTMPPEVARGVIGHVWDALTPGGTLVAYQFRGAVSDYASERFGPPEVASTEWINIPPMRVWTWRKPAAR